MRRRGLRDNNITTKRIMKDMIEEGRPDDAARVRAEMQPYRQTGIVKKFKSTGKIKRYKNSREFNAECAKNGNPFAEKAMICELSSIRQLANGEGIASVKVRPLFSGHPDQPNVKRTGTWRLHFGSYDILKRHLRGRVEGSNVGQLEGRKRRR